MLKEMLSQKMKMIKELLAEAASTINDGSMAVTDAKIVRKYIENPDFPFLVSFPRTGSHWLRMIMELYFKKPTLVRTFYYHKKKDFLCIHTHDMDLDIYRKNLIYLYRNPVPTVFSQMMYEKEDLNDSSRIHYWSLLYGTHLYKWLIDEKRSTKKTVITYENLQSNLISEFSQIVSHFDGILNPDKLMDASLRVSKNEVKKKTAHDSQVVNLNTTYSEIRQEFSRRHGNEVMETIFRRFPDLEKFICGAK